MKRFPQHRSIFISVLAIQAPLALSAAPLFAHEGHWQKREAEVERSAIDSQPAIANDEPSMIVAPESETILKTTPYAVPPSPSDISAEAPLNPATITDDEQPVLANATQQMNLGLGELTLAVLITGPFFLKFIRRQLQ